MQTIVAGLMALTAMGASILADVDPVTIVLRGGIAYFAGILLTGVWNLVVGPPKSEEKKGKKAKEPKAPKEPKKKKGAEDAAGDAGGKPAEVESGSKDQEEEQEEAA